MPIQVTCEDVWREVGTYIKGDVPPELRKAMDLHFQECRPCAVVLEGTQNLIRLMGGPDPAFQMPTDLCERLYRRQCEIQAEKQPKKT